MVACRAKTAFDTIHEKCPKVKASLKLSAQGYLQMCFFKSTMEQEIIHLHFGGGFFRIEAAFEVPVPLAHVLGLKEHRIRSGAYKVQEFEDHFLVDFGVTLDR